MPTQAKYGKKGCLIRSVSVTIAVIALGGLAPAQDLPTASGQGPGRPSNDPYYIVLCTDASGSMNESDPLYRDRSGKLTTLRDDAQLTFLTLLGECPIESFVGACKFSERILGGLPGGSSDTVPSNSALLAWHSVGSDWESLRENLSTRKTNAGGTRIETALIWAHRRISLARANSGTRGHGIIILLSDGDPDRATSELKGGVVLNAARALASDDVRVYSIIVNKASYRSGRGPGRLSDREVAAEQLMERVGSSTGGGTYRITATSGLLQIFLDVFRVVPTSPPIMNPTTFDVSRHHRTVVFIGPLSPSITIESGASGAAGGSYSLPVQDGLDEASGIDRRVIPLTMWNIIILRRPSDVGRLNKYWCGTWRPAPDAAGAQYGGRVYLITDFLIHLEVEPKVPSWTDERIQIAAHMVERPRELGEQTAGVPPLQGDSLSLSFQVNRGPTTTPLTIGAEKWDASGPVCRSLPFQLDTAGRYTVTCACVDRMEDRVIPLGAYSADLVVEPGPLSLVLCRAPNGEVVFPRASQPSQAADAVKGGEQVFAELRGQGNVSVADMDAQLHLTNATPAQHSFAADSGRLITGPFELPKGDVRLAGQAQVRLKDGSLIRQLNLPCGFLYDRGDLALTCQYSDTRTALWAGEYHKQVLQISVFPVFADSADAIANLFPAELPQAAVTFFDVPDSTPLTVPVRCALERLTRGRQDSALKLTGTYTLELAAPVPQCRRCEIDPGPVLADLNAGKKQYEVVDAARRGVFAYRIGQPSGEEDRDGVAETLAINEPVVFAVKRASDQAIVDIAFEFQEQGAGADKAKVLVPVGGTAPDSQIERSMQKELRSDRNYDVYVYATLRPEGSDQDVKLRLYGGSFQAVERHLELRQLVVGSGTGEDLSCHAMETIRIPLQACFTGYSPGNPDHGRLITAFKDSCRLVGITDNDRQLDASTSIQWTKAQASASEGANQSYRLEGYGQYTPDTLGRHRMELSGEIEVHSAGGTLQSVRTTNCRLFAKEPRFKVKVQEITPRTEKVLFDSERLVSGGKPLEPARNSYATQVRILLDFSGAILSASDRPVGASLAVKCRRPAETYVESVFEKQMEFSGGREKAEFVIDNPPLEQAGDYFLQLTTAGSEDSRVEFTTPVLVAIVDTTAPQEVIAPRGFLTTTVRQWPFAYRVPIQPSWSFDPIDLRFEFQFAGMKDRWLEGVASADKEKHQLIVRSPDYLPACEEAAVGPMKFRLRYMGVDRVTWESVSPVQIVQPCLNDVDLLWKRGGVERVSDEPNLSLRPPFALRIRPRFRSAAELQGWWSKQETRVWLAKAAGHAGDRSCTSPEYFARLIQLANAAPDGGDGVVRMLEPRNVLDEQEGIEILAEQAPRRRFWGLPRFGHREVYHVLASASYEERPSETVRAADVPAQNRVITEWTAPREVVIEKPWNIPYMWWLILGVTGACVSAQVTRKHWVPAPKRLGLSIHVRGTATVKPARMNQTVADLEHETSWSEETQMRAEFLSSRHPGWGRILTQSAAWLSVVPSRLFFPRRRLWISVRPEVARSATHIRTALMCVWTGVGRKQGAIWSSENGPIDLADDAETTELELNLGYRVNGDQMSAPVTVCIRRT